MLLVPPCMQWIARRNSVAVVGLSGTDPVSRAAHPPFQGRARHSVRAVGDSLNASTGNHGAQGTDAPYLNQPSTSEKRKAVSRLYRYQGPYVSRFVFWKMKTDPLFQAVEAAVPPHGEILDLGCGYGIVAHGLTLFATERTVRGVDFDADKIRVAQATARANPRVTFERRDILEEAEYPAADCVLLCDVLHYFPRELKAAVLRKIFQALRPGGCLIIRDAMAREGAGHHAVARSEQWAVRFGQNKTRHGLHFENEETHLALLREAGFVKLEVRTGSGLGSNRLLVATKSD